MTISENKLSFDNRDEYHRRPIAEKVIKLLESDIKVSPLVVDGSWGTGKTEFCHKLISLIESKDNKPFQPIYVDAFRADHADQPLMTLLAAVLKLAPSEDQPKLIRKVLPALRFGLKTAGKAGIGWVFKQDAVELGEDLEKALQEGSETLLNQTIETMLQDHIKAEQSLTTLQEVLKKISEAKPIVLFIDELDRCRPDFAVAMLEVIKHVFDIDSVKIVLITNTQQLKASINHCYGNELDAQRYLDKFIGFSFNLPSNAKPHSQHERELASQAHFKYLVTHIYHLENSAANSCDDEIHSLINSLIEIGKLSLREVDSFAKNMMIYNLLSGALGFSDNLSVLRKSLKIFAIYCKCFHPTIANRILHGEIPIDQIGRALNINKISSININQASKSNPIHLLLIALALENQKNNFGFQPENENQSNEWLEMITTNNHHSNNLNRFDDRLIILQETLRMLEATR